MKARKIVILPSSTLGTILTYIVCDGCHGNYNQLESLRSIRAFSSLTLVSIDPEIIDGKKQQKCKLHLYHVLKIRGKHISLRREQHLGRALDCVDLWLVIHV